MKILQKLKISCKVSLQYLQSFCFFERYYLLIFNRLKIIMEKNSWPTTFSQVWIFSWARLYSAQISSNSFKEAGIVKRSSSNTCIASERSFPKRTLILTRLFKKKIAKGKDHEMFKMVWEKNYTNSNCQKLLFTTLALKRYFLKLYKIIDNFDTNVN